jgi:pilus assembly protein Flp/PilA
MRALATLAHRLLRDRRGATMIEYALLIGLIALAMLASLAPVASRVVGMWNDSDADVAEAVGRER